MRVTNFAKRHPPFNHWEPIYIGTNEDPLYDERLSWEGRADKMTQVSFKRLFGRYVCEIIEKIYIRTDKFFNFLADH